MGIRTNLQIKLFTRRKQQKWGKKACSFELCHTQSFMAGFSTEKWPNNSWWREQNRDLLFKTTPTAPPTPYLPKLSKGNQNASHTIQRHSSPSVCDTIRWAFDHAPLLPHPLFLSSSKLLVALVTPPHPSSPDNSKTLTLPCPYPVTHTAVYVWERWANTMTACNTTSTWKLRSYG